jgi:prepilin-type N-terminal cleavage/methylation domain-containing protein
MNTARHHAAPWAHLDTAAGGARSSSTAASNGFFNCLVKPTLALAIRAAAPGDGRTPEPRTGGFTLMEILIASSIMAILLAAISAAFLGALRLRERTIDSIEASLPVEEALQTMQRDLANLMISSNGILIGPLQSINQTNTLPGQVGPDFYTSGGELDGMVPWGNVEKIDYLLTVPTNGMGGPGQDLIRAITRNLLPVNPPPLPEQKETLLSGVQSLTFLYYDGTQWDQAWDTTQQTNLPQAIKVRIQMAARGTGALTLNPPLELVVPVDVILNTNPVTAIQ